MQRISVQTLTHYVVQVWAAASSLLLLVIVIATWQKLLQRRDTVLNSTLNREKEAMESLAKSEVSSCDPLPRDAEGN